MCWISLNNLFITWRSSDDYLMIIYWCLHPLTTITLHQVFRLQLRCEHSRVLSFILGARWENWGISGDFLKYVYSIPLNAYDLSINVFQPECVVSDTDPLNLLRVICSLPMVRVVGNGIGEVMICTSHELWTSQFCNSFYDLYLKVYQLSL